MQRERREEKREIEKKEGRRGRVPLLPFFYWQKSNEEVELCKYLLKR
jgi:hypothetical protein